MHHLLDGHVKVFVAGLKFAIAKLLKSKPIAVRHVCLKVTKYDVVEVPAIDVRRVERTGRYGTDPRWCTLGC